MMREVLVAIFLALLCCQPVLAGDILYLSGGCGTGSLNTNNMPNQTVDTAGRNCIGLYYSYKNITGDATTSVKSSAGVLHSITFNNPTATETVTIYDSTSALGTKIGTITLPSSPAPVTLTYDVAFNTGLTIVTATASSDITIAYQ